MSAANSAADSVMVHLRFGGVGFSCVFVSILTAVASSAGTTTLTVPVLRPCDERDTEGAGTVHGPGRDHPAGAAATITTMKPI